MQLDNSMRQLCELEFLEMSFTVSNPVHTVSDSLDGVTNIDTALKRIAKQDRAVVNTNLLSGVSPNSYNLIERK